MFLSRLSVDIRSRTFRRDYENVQDMHRTMMSAFPELPAGSAMRQAHGVLWRLDSTNSGFVHYVQSQVKPDWTKLPVGHLVKPAEVRSLSPVLEAIKPGQKLSFRMVANPTKCENKTRKHVAYRQPMQQIEWLLRQGERHGFVIPSTVNGQPDVAPTSVATLAGRKEKTGRITIEPVRFDGHLVVTDAIAFTSAVANGIGRAKAYGCGLVSLARPK